MSDDENNKNFMYESDSPNETVEILAFSFHFFSQLCRAKQPLKHATMQYKHSRILEPFGPNW